MDILEDDVVTTVANEEDINRNVVPLVDEIEIPEIDGGRKRARESDSEDQKIEKLDEVENKINLIIEKLNLVPPNVNKSQLDIINFKLDFILTNLNLFSTVKDLENVVREVKKMSTSGDENVDQGSKEDVFQVLVACMSVAEIESKVPEFHFQEEMEKVVCRVCSAEFKYDSSLEQGRKQSTNLIDLKNRLKYHLRNSATQDILK